mgnify:CR=1 FL=1
MYSTTAYLGGLKAYLNGSPGLQAKGLRLEEAVVDRTNESILQVVPTR